MPRLRTLFSKADRTILIGVSALAFFLSLFLLLVEPFTGWLPWVAPHVPAITLGLVSSFVLSFFARDELLGEFQKWSNLGICAIYRGRSDPAQYDVYLRLLQSASQDLLIVGITLRDVPNAHSPLLLGKVKTGCSVRLLMLCPRYWQNREPILDPVAAGEHLKPHFHLAIASIRALATSIASMGPEVRGSFEVRFYKQAPTLSLTMVDGHLPSGRMRIEMTPHNSPDHAYFRPMLDLERAGEADLFGQFYPNYQDLWKQSEAYVRVQGGKIEVNDALDREISPILDLQCPWAPQQLVRSLTPPDEPSQP